jgi:hypothetical protein
MAIRYAGVACVLVALVFVAAACGGSKKLEGRSSGEWWADICTGMAEFGNGVSAEQRKVKQKVDQSRSAAEARRAWVHFLDVAVGRADSLLADMVEAGQPAVRNGDQLAREIRGPIATLKRALVQARMKAQKLPDEPEGFSRGLREITETILAGRRELYRQGKVVNDKYGTEELDRAFDSEPACEFLR